MGKLLPVTQEDRDAAADLVGNCGLSSDIRIAVRDDHPAVQAFAAHRIATRPTPAPVDEWKQLIELISKKQRAAVSGNSNLAARERQVAQVNEQIGQFVCENWPALQATPDIQALLGEVKEAGERIGPWLSAALDDETVCADMKSDIHAWMDSIAKLEQMKG